MASWRFSCRTHIFTKQNICTFPQGKELDGAFWLENWNRRCNSCSLKLKLTAKVDFGCFLREVCSLMQNSPPILICEYIWQHLHVLHVQLVSKEFTGNSAWLFTRALCDMMAWILIEISFLWTKTRRTSGVPDSVLIKLSSDKQQRKKKENVCCLSARCWIYFRFQHRT